MSAGVASARPCAIGSGSASALLLQRRPARCQSSSSCCFFSAGSLACSSSSVRREDARCRRRVACSRSRLAPCRALPCCARRSACDLLLQRLRRRRSTSSVLGRRSACASVSVEPARRLAVDETSPSGRARPASSFSALAMLADRRSRCPACVDLELPRGHQVACAARRPSPRRASAFSACTNVLDVVVGFLIFACVVLEAFDLVLVGRAARRRACSSSKTPASE